MVPIQEGGCDGLGVGRSQTDSTSVSFGAEGVSSRSKSNLKQCKPLGKLLNALVKLFTPRGAEDAATREYLQAMAKVNFLGYNGASDESCYPQQCKFRDCDRETHAMLVDLERSRLAEFTVLGIYR